MQPVRWQERYTDKRKTARAALKAIGRGDRIFVGSGAASPQLLIDEITRSADDIVDTEIVHIMTLGAAPYIERRFRHRFRHNAFFVGSNVRSAVAEGQADYTPILLSQIPALFQRRRFHLDVALIQVTPPDRHGFCSLGVSVDIVKAAAENASVVIAEVNAHMPRTLGDSFVHVDRIDALVEHDAPLPEFRYPEAGPVACRIAENVAGLVEDGSTLQMGIGSIPAALLHCLVRQQSRKDLGIHTEILTEEVVDAIEAGIVTNARKTLHPGKAVCSLCLGTQRLYDFVDQNPFFEFRPSDYVNDPSIIAQNDRMVAVNAALEVDLTGQVCSDSLGFLFYSGIGGQVDFVRGAARSKRGKPIIVLPSTTEDGGTSRIVSHLSEGAGVVTTRGDVRTVVTEYGVADLYGRNIRERALALINIAHPQFREELLAQAKLRHYAFVDQLPPLGVYPKELESRATFDGIEVFFRPVMPTDEALMQKLFYSLSEESIYYRFFTGTTVMPHARVQRFTTIDYQRELAIVAVVGEEGQEEIIAVGRYTMEPDADMAEVAFLVRDDWQRRGIGTWLQNYLIDIARSRGLVALKAKTLADNTAVLRLVHKANVTIESSPEEGGLYLLTYRL